MNDVIKHGSAVDAEEVEQMDAEEESERWEAGVAAAKRRPKPPASRSPAIPHPSQPQPITDDFLTYCDNSVFNQDWQAAYEECEEWKEKWRACHTSEMEWPEGVQLRGCAKQFMYEGGKLCVPTRWAKELVRQWNEGALGHAGQRKMLIDMKSRFAFARMPDMVKEVRSTCPVCQSCDAPNFHGAGSWQPTRYQIARWSRSAWT